MPNGWEVIKLGDVIKLSSGDTKPKDLSKEPSDSKPYPVYGGNNIMGYSGQKNSDTSIILIGRVGEYCGVTRYVDRCCWVTDNALFTRKVDSRVNIEYLAISLKSYDLSRLRNKGGQPLISQKPIYGLKLLLPPFHEQKKIAQILFAWDKAITVIEQLIDKSKQQKKSLMQQLLTAKRRLLDNNGARFKEEWEECKLSKLFERVTTKNNGQSTNVVTISGQYGLIRQEEFFKKTVASETLDGYFLIKKGQFAYNKSYSNGYPMGAIKRLNRYADGVVTTLYICFAISDANEAHSDYWEHYFASGLMNKALSQIAHEGGRAHGLLNVKPSDFFSLNVPVPGLDEQQKIATVLSIADQEVISLQQKLYALKQEKKALMQQLLTGKRRVKI